MSKKSITLTLLFFFTVGLLIGIIIGYKYVIYKIKAETESVEKYDPIEDSDYFKSIKDEVENKVYQSIVDMYTKDSLTIVYNEKYILVADTIPSAVIRALPAKEAYEKYFIFGGSCHIYWEMEQKILKEDYGVEWKSPAEMNPDNAYD